MRESDKPIEVLMLFKFALGLGLYVELIIEFRLSWSVFLTSLDKACFDNKALERAPADTGSSLRMFSKT